MQSYPRNPDSGRLISVLLVIGIVFLLSAYLAPEAKAAAGCGTLSPAPISGSTGAQGVLDPANTDATQGLVWPSGATSAVISMDTGQVQFSGASSGTAILPGVSGSPAFPDGKLNFISVHLPAGTSVEFITGVSGLPPPILLLSCQEVILEAGSSITGAPPNSVGQNQGLALPVPGAFSGGSGSNALNLSPAGFGPRSGSVPAKGTLYPPIGGGGGNAGANSGVTGPGGGDGGSAMVISAAQRITLDGTINAFGFNGASSGGIAQGGGGGSVRLVSLLVEGSGVINTSGGADSDNVKRSPDGPIEIQAFLQDFFAGSTTTTPIRGNAPVDPVPSNLPEIVIDQISTASPPFQAFEFLNTGSLTSPDVTLAAPSSAQTDVGVSIFAPNVPDGTILVFRAVGTDGSASTASASVSLAAATAHLSLNPATTYQIVVTPTTPFALSSQRAIVPAIAGGQAEAVLVAEGGRMGSSGKFPKKPEDSQGKREDTLARHWMKAFAVPRELAGNSGSSSGSLEAKELFGTGPN
jgi:hypothetical protein